MTASTIPETWLHITLGDVARVSSGMGFPHKYQGKQEGIYPVYKVGDISNAVINHKGNAFLAGSYVGELEAKELKGEVFSEGVTLFAKIGEAIKLNRRSFVMRAGLADNNVMAVIPEKIISKRFIYHFMHTVDLTDASRSTTVPSIRKGDIECLPLNIPSQAEQKEIADRLDTLLAQVEATQARLARIPDIIKQFRQSVLAAAVSGKLTAEWLVTQSSLTEVAEFQNGFAFKSEWFEKTGKYQVIKLGNIRDGFLALDNSPAYVSTTVAKEFSKFTPSTGDTLLSMTGTRLKKDYGFGCLIINEKNLLINQRVGRFIPNRKVVLPAYLNIFVRSDEFRSQFFEGETGGVNQGEIVNILLKIKNSFLPTKQILIGL
ncbi:restriction endonuclease subunit S [Aeromonas sp. S16(2024)]|uniref:restriction endonuclease subunit S n=1 Tax=Aeromonas sp. S16(2024) TaxID=3242889 RepID=UPI003526D757